MGYSHIFFDHDGVLVDTEPLYFQATKELLAELGVTLDLAEYLELQAHGANMWIGARKRGVAEAEIEVARDRRNERYQTLLQSQPIDIEGVPEVLADLRRTHTLAIVTTAKQSDFDLIHAERNIVEHMDLVLTNKDYSRAKPAPDPYLAALEHFGIKKEHALIVEDSARGLKAAVAAQIDCAAVYHPFTASQDLSAATYQIRELSELRDLVR